MNARKWAVTAVALTFLFTLPGFAQRGNVGGGRYDEQIQREATKILQSKDRWRGITASTDDAIVTLSGGVKVYIDKADAGKKVGKIDHVDGVRNHVEVTSTVPDQELNKKLADKLAYDRIGYGILFNNLTLQVQNGVATVGGQVHDYPSRDSALAIVESEPGVKDVIDNITVLPTSPFDDDLRIRVARAVYGDPALQKYSIDPQKPIRIIVDNGHVTLEGVVNTAMDKQIAEIRAKSVPNVFSVTNNLYVAGQQTK
jgi:hyperosmotically inducible protein